MSFSEYRASRSLRTNEKDLGKLVPAFVEGLIFFALCGQLDAAAVFPGLLEELRSSGHDIDSDPFVADLAILAAAEVDQADAPTAKQNASQGEQSTRRSGADRFRASQDSNAVPEEGRPPGQGRFLAAMGAVQRGDAVKAREHLEVAVQEGSFYAAHILGKMWLDGVFGKSSSELALSLFQRAAIAGLPEGIEDFWRTLATSKPSEVYKKSQQSAQQSHKKGDPIGSVNFAASQFFAPNADQEQQAAGIALMKKAAGQGSASATELLRKWGGGARG
jgi:TPR repeat protein